MRNTPNYNLPQYEGTDKFTKEVLNDAFNKIDLAIDDLQETFNINGNGSAITTQEVINARNGKENLKERIDEINSIVDTNTSQLESIEINNIGFVNILSFSNLKDGEYWDNALLEAIKTNLKIYLPKGTYKFKSGNITLFKGNIVYGDGKSETKLLFETNITSPFIFRFNMFTGFKDLSIQIVENYNGSVLMLDPGYVSKINNGSYHWNNSYILENIKIDMKWASGCGNGLELRMSNFDIDGVVYDENVKAQLVYFTPKNFEVQNANKFIYFNFEQKGNVARPVWCTANTFTEMRANSCVYGVYLEMKNSGNKAFLDVQDIKFIDFEVQTAHSGYFESTTERTQAIHIKGLPSPEWKPKLRMDFLTVWDSENGESGYLENAELICTNTQFTRTKNIEPYRYGFECKNARLSVNEDLWGYRSYAQNGKVTQINHVDGGISIYNDVDGDGGYKSNTQITNNAISSSLYSTSSVKVFDKNSSLQSSLEQGVVNNTAYLKFTGRDSGGNQTTHIKTGNAQNVTSTTSKTNKGFYALNSMWVQYEQIDITVPVGSTYQFTNIPFTTSFDGMPFLVSCNLEYTEHLGQYNIDLRNVSINTINSLVANIKHDRPTPLPLKLNLVLCGYKL